MNTCIARMPLTGERAVSRPQEVQRWSNQPILSPFHPALVHSLLRQKFWPYRYWVWRPNTTSGEERVKSAPYTSTSLEHLPRPPARRKPLPDHPLAGVGQYFSSEVIIVFTQS